MNENKPATVDLIKEAIEIIHKLNQVLNKMSPDGCPHVPKSNIVSLIKLLLETESKRSDTPLSQERLEFLVDSFNSMPQLCIDCAIEETL